MPQGHNADPALPALYDVVTQAEGLQQVGRLACSGGAGRTGRNRDIVQAHQQRLSIHAGEAQVEIVRQTMLRAAVDRDLVEAR